MPPSRLKHGSPKFFTLPGSTPGVDEIIDLVFSTARKIYPGDDNPGRARLAKTEAKTPQKRKGSKKRREGLSSLHHLACD